jgi:eukaryotic-like serine/threonine-protein kinase
MPTSYCGYTLFEALGRGGMSTVHRATNTRGDTVALKVFDTADREPAAVLARFQLERRRQVRHTNIVEVLDAGLCGKQPYLAMTLVAGESLQTRLRRQRRLSPVELLPLLRGIGSALDAVHTAGLLHCDVKPGNILIRAPDGQALLTDFGAARLRTSDPAADTAGVMTGTALYASPEQAQNATTLSPASDVYALAVTAFQALTGRTPFESDNELVLQHMHINEPVPDPRTIVRELPAGLAQVLMRGLDKDPRKRPAGAGEFVDAFEKALSARPVSPVVVPLIVATMLVALAGFAYWVAQTLPEPIPAPRVTALPAPTLTPEPRRTAALRVTAPATDVPAPVAATPTLSSAPTEAPASPTPQVTPTATPTAVVTSTLATLRVTVPTGRAGYEDWGALVSPDRCETDDGRGRTQRLEVRVRIANPSQSDLTNWSATFVIGTAQGDVMRPACVDQGLALPPIPANSEREVTLLGYADTRTVRSVTIRAPGFESVSLCFNENAELIACGR